MLTLTRYTWFTVLFFAACLQISAANAADIACKSDNNKRMGPKGNVTSCLLSEDAKFGNYTCVKGKIAGFYPDGKLKNCYLTTPVVISGISCKDALALSADGELRRCKSTASASVGTVKDIPAGSWISLYKGGALRRVEVAKPMAMNGYSCKGYHNYFHENGQLMKCQLGEDKEIDKTLHKAGAFLCWDNKGKSVADCKMIGKEILD